MTMTDYRTKDRTERDTATTETCYTSLEWTPPHHHHDQEIVPLLALQCRLMTLKLLPRTGWLQRGVYPVESIAEHTFGVATLALFLSDAIPGLDRGRLLAMALLHDMAEVLIGDLPMTAHHLLDDGIKHQAERRAILELLHGLPQAPLYLELWDEYTRRDTREARLLKQLDRLEMLIQALAYERAGSRNMAEFWEDAHNGWSTEFPLVCNLAAQLITERERTIMGREQR